MNCSIAIKNRKFDTNSAAKINAQSIFIVLRLRIAKIFNTAKNDWLFIARVRKGEA
jgi:hypothetical protein